MVTDPRGIGSGSGDTHDDAPGPPDGGAPLRPEGDTRAGLSRILHRLLQDAGALGALVALCAVLAILSPDFLSTANLLNIGDQAAVTTILAFGVTFVIVSAGIDLSVGSVAALSAMVLAYSATEQGLPLWLALLLSLAAGTGCGMVNGLLTSYGRLPSFIATLAMLSAARGLTEVLSDGAPIALPAELDWLSEDIGGWLPAPVIVLLLMTGIAAIVLNLTYSGRAMYAIGGNEEAARLSGIRVRRHKLLTFALCGAFAAVAGIIFASRLLSAQPNAAEGYELDAIAACVIGGASLAGGVGRVSGTLIGALILAVLRNGLNLLNVEPFWQDVLIGAVIALAALLDALRRRR